MEVDQDRFFALGHEKKGTGLDPGCQTNRFLLEFGIVYSMISSLLLLVGDLLASSTSFHFAQTRILLQLTNQTNNCRTDIDFAPSALAF